MNDLRYAFRQLTKHPGFAATAVLTLALGVGATTAVFAIVRAVIVNPLPYDGSEDLVALDSPVPGMGPNAAWNLSQAGFFHFREASRALEDLGGYAAGRENLVRDAGAIRVAGAHTTASLLRVVRARPAVGRLYGDADDRPGAAYVAVLGHDFWVRAFGADSGVVGTVIDLESVSREVIGVMDAGIELPDNAVDIWVPLQLDPAARPVNSHWLPAIGRLNPGFAVADADRELAGLTERFPELFPQAYQPEFMRQYGFTTRAVSLHERVVGDFAGLMWVLLAAVGIVLAIAAANVGNLFAVRTEARRRELAVRAALGAGRRHLLRHGLSEGWVIGALAGAVGVVFATAAVSLLLALAPEGIPRLAEIGLRAGDAAFAIGVALVAGTVVGLFPAWRGGAAAFALREAGSGLTPAPRQHVVRRALVMGQVALALVLLTAAGLLVRSWQHLRSVEPGLDPENVVTFDLSLPAARYRTYDDVVRFYRELGARVEALPGVRSVGAGPLPLRDFGVCAILFVEDQPVVADERPRCVARPMVAPGYFDALGIRLEGAAPAWTDVERGAAGVVVTPAFARRIWPGEDPIGKGIRGNGWAQPFYRVVGVTGELRADGLERAPTEAVFFPMRPMEDAPLWGPQRAMPLVVRTIAGRPEALTPAVRRILTDLDPTVPLGGVATMDRVLARSVARRSFAMLLLGVAAGMALLLSVVGLYGVVAYVVRRRTAEIGIRMALGARASEVARMVVRDGVLLGLGGAALGLAGAVAATRVLRSLLFEVSPTDPATLAAVTVLLVGITLVASLIPARRAARIDPLEALRHE